MASDSQTVRRTVQFKFTLPTANSGQLVSLLKSTAPFYEAFGARRMRLLQNVDDPAPRGPSGLRCVSRPAVLSAASAKTCRFRQSGTEEGAILEQARQEDAMTKRHEAKYKIDRRMGQNVWGRPKSPVNRREYGPGQHGRRLTIPSYRVKVGDLIEVKDQSKQLAIVLEAVGLAERDVPDYIEVDHSKMTAKLTRIPQLTEVPYPVQMEPHLVVEFYSR